jgi:WhiB family transcriptional regulator, redox-sensing transcriptional regulator
VLSGSPLWQKGDSERFPDAGSVPEWHYYAACAAIDIDEADRLFFPGRGQSVNAARAICLRCPVLDDCRDWALDQTDELYGVWGATSKGERRQLRRAVA